MSVLYQRSRWEGVMNIIRFNWHFYVLAFVVLLLAVGLLVVPDIPFLLKKITAIGTGIVIFYLVCSLAVSHIIYDRSDLYRFEWLRQLSLPETGHFVNVHSGFDETSLLLKQRFPKAAWTILDFYDPNVHTELSISRARRYKPALQETLPIQTNHWPLESGSVDIVFGFLAIHEIRSYPERIAFFKEIHRVVKEGGKLIVVEHLRDTANFFAYGPGFLHFFPEKTWHHAFIKAEFRLMNSFSLTPFVRVFILVKKNK